MPKEEKVMRIYMLLNEVKESVIGKFRNLMIDERGDDGGTRGVGFVAGIFVVITVIGLIVAGINAALPNLITDMFDKVSDTLGL